MISNQVLSIGFTGTRRGLTLKQRSTLQYVVVSWAPFEAHHGDCIGADATFHSLCRRSGCDVIVHPPSDNKLRAYTEGYQVLEPKPYLERNRDIVDATRILIACPAQRKMQRRSGTWATVRYALGRQGAKSVAIVYPDGSHVFLSEGQ